MKLQVSYILILFALLLINPGLDRTTPEVPNAVYNDEECGTENISFTHGENVVYKVYYNWNFVWLSAGEVTFNVSETENDYHISATGRTYSSYEWFYKVRDYYYTKVDKETLLPSLFIRDIHEGSYKLYDKINFDQDSQKGTSLRGSSKEEAKLHNFDFDKCMHDLVSIVYKMRNLDFNGMNTNTSIPVKIFLDMEEYPLDIRFQGREKNKKVKGQGRFNTIKISPELIEGNVFKEGQQMNIWVSDDKNHVPLIIESPVSVGSVKVILKEYNGLKHPFTSKLN